jgi:hypothetical protein
MARSPNAARPVRFRAVGGLIAAALTLTACDIPLATSGPDDQSEIRDVLEWAFVENDPDQCTSAVTERFRDQSFPGEGDEALSRCIELNTDDEPAMATRISMADPEIEGDAATASVRVDEGKYVGWTITLGLVKEEDEWRLDSFQGFDLNRKTFDRVVRSGLIEDGYTDAEADCVTAQYRRSFSTAELERLLAEGGDESGSAWVPGIALCMDGARIRSLWVAAMREEVEEYPHAVARCAVSVIERQSTVRLRALMAAVPSGGGRVQLADICRQLGAACAEKARAAIAKQREAQAKEPKPAAAPPSPRNGAAPAPSEPASQAAPGGSSGADPTGRYLDCIAVAGSGREMKRCEQIVR